MNLQLSLKTKWFEMTKLGIKTEDYREITPYWCNRLMLYLNEDYSRKMYKRMLDKWSLEFIKKLTEIYLKQDTFKQYKINTIRNGKNIIKFDHAVIEIRTGNPDWGAEPNKLYFVIKHGKIIT